VASGLASAVTKSALLVQNLTVPYQSLIRPQK